MEEVKPNKFVLLDYTNLARLTNKAFEMQTW